MNWFKKKRIYLDYAAATPVLPEVKGEMEKYWSKDFYNPNAIYAEGVAVKNEVEKYRTQIAKLLNVAKENIIFTSGGTEANVLAVRGVKSGKVIFDGEVHPSVIDAASMSKVPFDTAEGPTLVSSVTTDNKLGRKIRAEDKLLHVDASQTAQYFNVGLEQLSCDLLTLDAAKMYGPKGCGALVVRRGVKLNLLPLGTPTVPLIAGFAKAFEIAVCDRESEFKRLSQLSEQFVKEIEKELPEVEVVYSAPNIINVSVPNVLPELLVLALDRAGIMVSAGPACNANKPEPPETPVRISLGKFTTQTEVEKAGKIFCQEVRKLLKYA